MANCDVESHIHNHTYNHTHIPGTEDFFFFFTPYAGTTRYEDAFFSLENQGKNRFLRSRASLILVTFE